MEQSSKNIAIAAACGVVTGSLLTYLVTRKPAPELPKNVTLTYWKGRGKAEAIRLMLAASGIKWKHSVPGEFR